MNPFIKTGPPSALKMFEAEAEGLREIEATGTVRVPDVFQVGVADGQAFIEMERLDIGRSTDAIHRLLGEQLAAMHRHTADNFGWHRENTIGMTPQRNPWSGNWIDFFREHRLLFQIDLAASNGYRGEVADLGHTLANGLDVFFADYEPVPSLLHGDLWSGNHAAMDGAPVIFDPAVYYGDRESDLAMTRLFGGFGAGFYQAYEKAWPLAPGHESRNDLYQLYHVLNHLNLFGSGYLSQSMSLLRRLVASIPAA